MDTIYMRMVKVMQVIGKMDSPSSVLILLPNKVKKGFDL